MRHAPLYDPESKAARKLSLRDDYCLGNFPALAGGFLREAHEGESPMLDAYRDGADPDARFFIWVGTYDNTGNKVLTPILDLPDVRIVFMEPHESALRLPLVDSNWIYEGFGPRILEPACGSPERKTP